jgi:hypothetical protein
MSWAVCGTCSNVGAQVADERTDLGMEAAELDRLTVELQHKGSTRDSGWVNAFRHR